MELKDKIIELMGQARAIADKCETAIKDPEQVHLYGALVTNKAFMRGYETACREILDVIEDEEWKRKEVKKNGGKKGRDANQGS